MQVPIAGDTAQIPENFRVRVTDTQAATLLHVGLCDASSGEPANCSVVSGGDLTLGALILGDDCTGANNEGNFNVNGGSVTVGDITFGTSSSSAGGVVAVNSGSLTVTNNIAADDSSTTPASVLLNGGIFSVGGSIETRRFVVGQTPSSVVSYTIQGPMSLSGALVVGANGDGTLNFDIDESIPCRRLVLGESAGSAGVLTIDHVMAEMSLGATRSQIGLGGQGTLNLIEGQLNVAFDFYIGEEVGSVGVLEMDGGTLAISDQMRIGHSGSGTMLQHGGSTTLEQTIIGTQAGSQGTLTLTGGSIAVSGGNLVCGRK